MLDCKKQAKLTFVRLAEGGHLDKDRARKKLF